MQLADQCHQAALACVAGKDRTPWLATSLVGEAGGGAEAGLRSRAGVDAPSQRRESPVAGLLSSASATSAPRGAPEARRDEILQWTGFRPFLGELRSNSLSE